MNGRMVGRAMIEWSIATGTSSTWIFAEVSGEFRRRGIGSALFDCVETLALESGRPIVQSEVLHTARTGGERLPSPTGFGDLSMADDGVVFLRRRGYRLEQIERISFLHLPVNEALLENAFRAARDAAGDQYEVVAWTGRTPGSDRGSADPARADERGRSVGGARGRRGTPWTPGPAGQAR